MKTTAIKEQSAQTDIREELLSGASGPEKMDVSQISLPKDAKVEEVLSEGVLLTDESIQTIEDQLAYSEAHEALWSLASDMKKSHVPLNS